MDRAKIVLITLTISLFFLKALDYFSSPLTESSEIFYDISTKIKYLPEEKFFGVAPFFLDSDKNFELLLSGHGIQNAILSDDGFNLKPIKENSLKDPFGQTTSVTPCDLDGDGTNELFAINEDVVIGNKVSKSRLFKKTMNEWIDLLENERKGMLSAGVVGASCLDRDNDNRFELLIITDSRPFKYLELHNGKLVDIAKDVNIDQFITKARSSIIIPDKDGRPNVFIGVKGDSNIFLKLNKQKKFDQYAIEASFADSQHNATGVSLIDFNNDENIDIVFGNENGPIKLFKQNADASFSEVKSKHLNKVFLTSSLAVSDFDLDGSQDLYINSRSGRNYLFLNKLDSWQEEVIITGLESNRVGTSVFVGDLLFDGSNEVLITHGVGGKSKPTLYSTRSHNNWIGILPILKTGEIARNALVIAQTNLGRKVRVITTGSSPNSSNLPLAHFGFKKNERLIKFKVVYNERSLTFSNDDVKMLQVNIVAI